MGHRALQTPGRDPRQHLAGLVPMQENHSTTVGMWMTRAAPYLVRRHNFWRPLDPWERV